MTEVSFDTFAKQVRKEWTKERIQALLDDNSAALPRALLVVYANQTADEQATDQTKHQNGVGFTGADAEFLSDIAKKWMRYRRWASEKQRRCVLKAVRKYWRQLQDEIVERQWAQRQVQSPAAATPVSQPIPSTEQPAIAGTW